MKAKFQFLIFFHLSVLLNLNANGTEIILLNNDTFELRRGEIELLKHHVKFDSLSKFLLDHSSSGFRRRGFVLKNVVWVIIEKILYLKEIEITDYNTLEKIDFNMNQFFNLCENEMYSSDSLSTKIIAGKGGVLYDNLLENYFRIEIELTIGNGVLENIESWTNSEVEAKYSGDSLFLFLYKNINWDKIPKRMLRKNYCAEIYFEVNEKGEIEKIKINKSDFKKWKFNQKDCNNVPRFLRKESLRVVKLIPNWTVYIIRGAKLYQRKNLINLNFNQANKELAAY